MILRFLPIVSAFCMIAAPALAAPAAATPAAAKSQPGASGTTLPPPPPDAIVIHVSTDGVDGQDGRTPETAIRTLRRAVALIRNNSPDRILLRRGDTFEEVFGNFNRSGRSPQEPVVIGSYGTGPRPKILARDTVFNIYGNGDLHDVAIVGLHLLAAGRDPDAVDFDPGNVPSPMGVRVVKPVRGLTIEDCRIERFSGNLVLTGSKSERLKDVIVRRCVVLDSWSNGGEFSGQGLYADKVDGLTIEDCVFDHNGWNEKVPGAGANLFRHNLYVSVETSGVTLRGCVVSYGASHGVQMRSGGLCERNLFYNNAIHAFLGGKEAVFRDNVIVGGRNIDAKNPRGHGVTVAAGRGVVADNLIVHKPTTDGAAIRVERGKWSPPEGVSAEITGNVVYAWSGNGLEVSHETVSLVFSDNDLQRIARGRKLVTIKQPYGTATFSGNRYHSEEPTRAKWFSLPTGFVPVEQWSQLMRDASKLETARYRDAATTLPKDFIEAVRAEDAKLSVAAVIDRLRESFGKKPLGGGADKTASAARREKAGNAAPVRNAAPPRTGAATRRPLR